MLTLFRKKLSYAEFWHWFADHSEEYLRIDQDKSLLLNQLEKQLHKADPELGFLIGPFENNRRELVISCDGIRRNMTRVQALVAAAPGIPGWRIIAFKPAYDIATAEYQGKTLSVGDVYFSHRPVEDGYMDILLFIDDYTADQQKHLMALSFILLDGLIGELAVMSKLRKIQFADLAKADRSQLEPLAKLPELIR